MDLNIQSWKEFQIGRIFNTNIAKSVDYNNTESGNNLYIGRTSENNGVQGRVSNETVEEGNCIIIGMVGENWAFYQTQPFVASQNIFVLRNKHLNHYTAMFLCSVLNKCVEVFRDTYSLPLGKEKMNARNIKLPIRYNPDGSPVIDANSTYSDCGYIPDWDFMEQYIKSLNYKPLTTNNHGNELPVLDVDSWKEFCLGDIFDIKKGKRLTSDDQTDGNTPYIGAIDSNNGVANYIGQKAIHDGNTISLSYNGSVGEAFYQPNPFWATDDVNVLYFRPENNIVFNKYIALFFCAILRQEKYRYSYGRKWVLDSMRTTTIKLPVNNGKPDYAFMERYMRALPYGDRI